jgi:hypothetical protein
MPPTAVPKKNGVISEDPANTAPNSLASPNVARFLRSAKLAPRNTIPASASVSGMLSVIVAAAKAVGKPDHYTTST